MAQLPEGYQPITIDLVEDYNEYWIKTPRKAADYTFTNLWGWAEQYGLGISFRQNLCWICRTKPKLCFWAPAGAWHEADWAAHPEIEQGASLARVPLEMVEIIEAHFGADKIQRVETRDQWEYLYSQEELAKLGGNRFHKKRNHVNAYIKTYGEDYRCLDYRLPNGIEDMLKLQTEWCKWRDCEHSPSLQAEHDAIFRVIGNWGRLDNLVGGSLYVEDNIVAFAIGEPLDKETMVVHFEKVQPDYRGVYQAINNAFVRNAAKGFTVINREQDMGEDGLRQAKETYNPIGFLKKYSIKFK